MEASRTLLSEQPLHASEKLGLGHGVIQFSRFENATVSRTRPERSSRIKP
jgi:hypothetical protein